MLNKLKTETEIVLRHIQVIKIVSEHQPIGILKLSEITKIPSHKIRYSLKVLEQLGYIQASPAGAVATPKAAELMENLDAQTDEIIALLKKIKAATES
ncbi:conserved hypothetical protein [Methanolacinia petrolearia DSM 11571]|uniref:Uncharacterized protein n=1 Tax=Methanolacinia petrolearia (strain DSM 11571 / OCM 486 / SEBR 4847) TaxID=679926 RepID=E1RHP2_METP4|nr:hypothetical protein [Methanolacinia petrolearia]ADN35351.1 conserved hypothetical protein [Methanolacinia petrolearia DSM 11571]